MLFSTTLATAIKVFGLRPHKLPSSSSLPLIPLISSSSSPPLRFRLSVLLLRLLLRLLCSGMWASSENVFSRSSSYRETEDDEQALRWAALERLPTYDRVRRGILRNVVGDLSEVVVEGLELEERKLVLDRLVDAVNEDAEQIFDRMRRRFDA